jgi:hypothetical protein
MDIVYDVDDEEITMMVLSKPFANKPNLERETPKDRQFPAGQGL